MKAILYFSFFVCITSYLLASPVKSLPKRIPSPSSFKSSSSLARTIGKSLQSSLSASTICSAWNNTSRLLIYTEQRSLPAQNPPMAPHCLQDEIQILYHVCDVSQDVTLGYVCKSIFSPSCPASCIHQCAATWLLRSYSELL